MWNILNNNNICSEKELFQTQKIYYERLLNKKPYIKLDSPKVPSFIKNKLYYKESMKLNEYELNSQNISLYKRILDKKSAISPYSKIRNTPKYCAAFDYKKFNFTKIENYRKIFEENKSFFKRFSLKKPTYSTKKLLKESKYENYIKNNISRIKFLSKISLNMCTFKQFESNLSRSLLKNKVCKKVINHPSRVKHLRIIKSNSIN